MSSPGSTEGRGRANAIRELVRSRQNNSSRASNGSSSDSIRHHGQHVDAQVTETQELLPIPLNAQYEIDTSALHRAFPDFSQDGSEDEDSIEVGRGIGMTRRSRNASNRYFSSVDVSEDMSLNLGLGGNYRVTGTPPVKPRQQRAIASNVGIMNTKDTTNELANIGKPSKERLEKVRDFASGPSIKPGQNDKRSVVEMHARVESDDSAVLSDGRPSAIAITAKNTRFDNRHARQPPTNNTASGNQSANLVVPQQPHPNNTTTSNVSVGNGTYQSVMLPNLPNIHELISGERQDGTPLFPRSAKARSRFATLSGSRRIPSLKQTYIPIDSVAVPAQEKALYVSLQLMQEKLATLEKEKADSEARNAECELELLQLKSNLEEQEHNQQSDSGLVLDEHRKPGAWLGERSELERSMKLLQDRLDRANRKLATSALTVANLIKEKEDAHEQLVRAYVSSEELQSESQAIQEEIESVKQNSARIIKQHEARIARLTRQEVDLRGKIQRREKAVNQMGALAKDIWNTRQALVATKASSATQAKPIQPQHSAAAASKADRTTSDRVGEVRQASNAGAPRMSSISRVMEDTTTASNREPRIYLNTIPGLGKNGGIVERNTTIDIQLPPSTSVGDAAAADTFSSFMEGDEIPTLQKILRDDKTLLARAGGTDVESVANNTAAAHKSSLGAPMPRKSSLKQVMQQRPENTGQTQEPPEKTQDRTQEVQIQTSLNTARTGVSFSRQRDDTQRSVTSQCSERPHRNNSGQPVEMTSAFILPDITLAAGAAVSRTVSGTTANSKQTIVVSRPVPVSDRFPNVLSGDTDMTVRPGQSPGLALATVLKGLEDELVQLRAQLSQQEILYNQHDPALSKRMRKSVVGKIQQFLAAIEIRADQIYALYDVLEGQKANGQLMTDEEVEVTLVGLGISTSTTAQYNSEARKNETGIGRAKAGQHDVGDESEDYDENYEDDDELPWEGIEPTLTQKQTLESLGDLRA